MSDSHAQSQHAGTKGHEGQADSAFALKGTILYSESPHQLTVVKDGYVICRQGICQGVYPCLPKQYQGILCVDYQDALIIPGMTDLHIHAPQFPYRGTSMDLELLEWLNTVTFPQEAKYRDADYARRAYQIFAQEMKKGATTSACIFGTMHVEATEILMDLMEETGIRAYVGKVNMDRNSPDILREESWESSIAHTRQWLEDTVGRYCHVKPILTPRFTPSCTDKLMEQLAVLQKEYHLPVQSHLSENLSEIQWVRELCPDAEGYGDTYDRYGMFGGSCPTIMAHCVYLTEKEIRRMKEQQVFVAHCPESNMDLSSGIAPVRRYLEEGIPVGLGTDVAGGHHSSVLHQIGDAIGMSKLRWRLVDQSLKPLTLSEAFYMATMGGGAFFGKVGSFLPGYAFDAVVLTDQNFPRPYEFDPIRRLEQLIYLGDDRNLIGKYCSGKQIRL